MCSEKERTPTGKELYLYAANAAYINYHYRYKLFYLPMKCSITSSLNPQAVSRGTAEFVAILT